MEEIIKIYGKFLLEAAVVVLLIVFLSANVTDGNGNTGIFRIIGAGVDTATPDYPSYGDYPVYEEEGRLPAPVIEYHGGNSIRVGSVRLSDHITASDHAGGALEIRVLSVTDKEGKTLPVAEDTTVEFKDAGIWSVRVRAVDAAGRRTECLVQVPVSY